MSLQVYLTCLQTGMSAIALLHCNLLLRDDEISEALANNLYRCKAYGHILELESVRFAEAMEQEEIADVLY